MHGLVDAWHWDNDLFKNTCLLTYSLSYYFIQLTNALHKDISNTESSFSTRMIPMRLATGFQIHAVCVDISKQVISFRHVTSGHLGCGF